MSELPRRIRAQAGGAAAPVASAAPLQESLRKLHLVESSRESFAKSAVKLIARAAGAQAAALLSCDPRASRVRLLASIGLPPDTFRVLVAPAGMWIPLRALNERRINVIARSHQNPFVPQHLTSAIAPEGVGIAAIPFFHRDVPSGAAVLFSTNPATLGEGVLQSIAQALRASAPNLTEIWDGRGLRTVPPPSTAVAPLPCVSRDDAVQEEPLSRDAQELIEHERRRVSELEGELDGLREAKDRLPELQAEVERLNAQAAEAQAMAEAARAEAARLEAERAEAEQRATAAAQTLEALVQSNADQQRRIEESLHLSRRHTETVTDLEAHLSRIAARAERTEEFEQALHASETARANLEAELSQLRRQAAEARERAEQASAALGEQKAEAEAARAEITALVEYAAEFQREAERSAAEAAEARARADAADTRGSKIEAELATAHEVIGARERAGEEAEQVWMERMVTVEGERDQAREEAVQLRQAFEDTFTRLREQVEASDQERRQLQERLAAAISQPKMEERARPQTVASTAASQAPAPDSAVVRVATVAGTGGAAAQRPAETPGAMLRIDVSRLNAIVGTVGRLDLNRGRARHGINTLRQLRDGINAWRTRLVEVDRTETPTDALARLDPEPREDLATHSAHICNQLTKVIETLQLEDNDLATVSYELQEKIDTLRLVPLEMVFRRLRRPTRDAARQCDKRAELVTEGGHIQLDRPVTASLYGPLLHLVRNAVAHGIELPEIRTAAGKDVTGRVAIRARIAPIEAASTAPSRDSVVLCIDVSDDGKGLDLPAILAKARSRSLVAADETLDDAGIAALIFQAGLSTAGELSDLAGRGVGMDVVANEITALGGNVGISSEAGHGTTIHITMPLRTARA